MNWSLQSLGSSRLPQSMNVSVPVTARGYYNTCWRGGCHLLMVAIPQLCLSQCQLSVRSKAGAVSGPVAAPHKCMSVRVFSLFCVSVKPKELCAQGV